MQFPNISIVVPFYIFGSIFQDCVSLTVSQGYENTEILLANDESIDNIVPNLLLRIKLQEQTHLGVSAVRNSGLSHAMGENVIFGDSDNFFDKIFIFQLVCGAMEHKSDMVVCGFYFCN